MMLAVLVVTVIGLKVVGLVLIVALLIIPPVAARFWTDKVGRMIWIAGCIGARRDMSGRRSRPLPRTFRPGRSSSSARRPSFSSMLFAPTCADWRRRCAQSHFKARVHHRQGLLALARQEPIREGYTLRLLQREGLIRADGVPTDAGRGGGQGLQG
jgi:manganese/zinc/iron transport system permease protein